MCFVPIHLTLTLTKKQKHWESFVSKYEIAFTGKLYKSVRYTPQPQKRSTNRYWAQYRFKENMEEQYQETVDADADARVSNREDNQVSGGGQQRTWNNRRSALWSRARAH